MASATIQFLIQPQLTGLAQHYGEGIDSIHSLHIGDIRAIGPFTMEPTYNSLNGSTGFPRKRHEALLRDVLGLVRVAGYAQTRAVDHPGVPPGQFGERLGALVGHVFLQ